MQIGWQYQLYFFQVYLHEPLVDLMLQNGKILKITFKDVYIYTLKL